MAVKQHKHASPVELQPGDSVMIQVPERRSKLSPKFEEPRLVLKRLHANKLEVFDSVSNKVKVMHDDRLKQTNKSELSTASVRTNSPQTTNKL